MGWGLGRRRLRCCLPRVTRTVVPGGLCARNYPGSRGAAGSRGSPSPHSRCLRLLPGSGPPGASMQPQPGGLEPRPPCASGRRVPPGGPSMFTHLGPGVGGGEGAWRDSALLPDGFVCSPARGTVGDQRRPLMAELREMLAGTSPRGRKQTMESRSWPRSLTEDSAWCPGRLWRGRQAGAATLASHRAPRMSPA